MEIIWNIFVMKHNLDNESSVDEEKSFHEIQFVIKVDFILFFVTKNHSILVLGCRVTHPNLTFSKSFYRHRENVYYTCNNNSVPLLTNQKIRCLNGSLSEEPICQTSNYLHRTILPLINLSLVQCIVPHALFLQNIINTSIPSGTSIEHGSTFTYACLEDYQAIIESASVECLDDGRLSHQAQCIPRSCKEHPPTIADGRTIFHSTKHGTIARYRCFPGYRMENNHPGKLTCQFGQWLPKQPPRCLPSECLELDCRKRHTFHVRL